MNFCCLFHSEVLPPLYLSLHSPVIFLSESACHCRVPYGTCQADSLPSPLSGLRAGEGIKFWPITVSRPCSLSHWAEGSCDPAQPIQVLLWDSSMALRGEKSLSSENGKM